MAMTQPKPSLKGPWQAWGDEVHGILNNLPSTFVAGTTVTQSEYDALNPPVEGKIYFIVADPG